MTQPDAPPVRYPVTAVLTIRPRWEETTVTVDDTPYDQGDARRPDPLPATVVTVEQGSLVMVELTVGAVTFYAHTVVDGTLFLSVRKNGTEHILDYTLHQEARPAV